MEERNYVKQLPKTAKVIRGDWDKVVYESKKYVYYAYYDGTIERL